MITKEKKQKIISGLNKNAENAKNIVFLNFHGESVKKTSALRKELRKKDAFYQVAKKTLIQKSLSNYGIQGGFPDFKGEMAAVFVYSEDIQGILKYILSLAREGKFKITGGVFENEFKDDVFMSAISKIPGREVLYYSLVNTINAPIKQTVDALSGVIVNFIRVLDQIAKAK